MSAPAVAVTPDGKQFAAAWKDVREGPPRVWWAQAGKPRFGAESPIADEPRIDRDHPSLAVGEHGEFWAAWEDGTGRNRHVRARSSSTKVVRDVEDATTGSPAFPVIACGAGLVVVAWEETVKGSPGRVLVRVLEDARR
jgi:hypothetical protein